MIDAAGAGWYGSDMAKPTRAVSIRLAADQAMELERLATHLDRTTTWLVREAIKRLLADPPRKES